MEILFIIKRPHEFQVYRISLSEPFEALRNAEGIEKHNIYISCLDLKKEIREAASFDS